ncbi:alpha/beta hydrolase family esterase [Microbulbifer rhizosphaerae]|uniref:Poly(3-hydroxybutyrate) depolymerase n=1 Tax=Microbulbifer rhizosphaerae TaxID=1562603 RepID=A0A7W4WDZ5_9GAMM|nr:PHB depolymerase family esterase [Microbulbifer rhizosphaerae]MBB3062495.1 poly(3-hydroxybutyrate) depolymerase [Microbulbifer rhizosphaerae]
MFIVENRGQLARHRHAIAVFSLMCLTTCPLLLPSASAATLTQVSNFGNNPGNLEMYLYVPDNLTGPAPVLVALHYCTDTEPVLFSNTQFASLADQYGYIVIYPSVTRSSQCFDVYSSQALTRGGGSDPVSVKSMIDYVVQNHKRPAGCTTPSPATGALSAYAIAARRER